MATFRVHFRSKGGDQFMLIEAASREKAEQEARRAQFRRHERFPLTFARLEEAAASGQPGQLAIDPRLTGKALTGAWVAAEVERRKRDQARYDDDDLTIVKVEAVK